MSYNKYPKEMKEAIIARMLEGDETVTDIQRDTGVCKIEHIWRRYIMDSITNIILSGVIYDLVE